MRIPSGVVICALATSSSYGSAFQFSRHRADVPKSKQLPSKSNQLHQSARPNIRLHASTLLRAMAAPDFASDLSPGVDAINAHNSELLGLMSTVRKRPFFRLYSVDILASCEYMPQELFECYSESCEIYPVDDDEVSPRASVEICLHVICIVVAYPSNELPLTLLPFGQQVPEQMKSVDFQEHGFELDGWARWDMPTEDYYDTIQFPEEFTGYDGADVWRFIHKRIAFNEDVALRDAYSDESWKADFNRAVSGLHAMISAQCCRGIGDQIASGQADENETQWTDPKAEFDRRLGPGGETPEAIENLYFTYMLLLSAVSRVRDRLLADCSSGKIDATTASALQPVLSHALLDDPDIAAASKQFHDHAAMDSGSLRETRMRVRELMRIMNCVQCNKCRLHGKISVMGISTALKILLGDTGTGGDVNKLHRVELAALMAALGKFSTGVDYCQSMVKA